MTETKRELGIRWASAECKIASIRYEVLAIIRAFVAEYMVEVQPTTDSKVACDKPELVCYGRAALIGDLVEGIPGLDTALVHYCSGFGVLGATTGRLLVAWETKRRASRKDSLVPILNKAFWVAVCGHVANCPAHLATAIDQICDLVNEECLALGYRERAESSSKGKKRGSSSDAPTAPTADTPQTDIGAPAPSVTEYPAVIPLVQIGQWLADGSVQPLELFELALRACVNAGADVSAWVKKPAIVAIEAEIVGK